MNSPSIENAKMEFHYNRGRRERVLLRQWLQLGVEKSEVLDSSHGCLNQMQIFLEDQEDRLQFTLTFALPQDHPFLIWKIVVTNLGRKPVHVNRLEMISAGFVKEDLVQPMSAVHLLPLPKLRKFIDTPIPGEVAFFSNGWQSWSYTGVYRWKHRDRYPRLGPLRAPVITNAGTPHPRQPGLFSSDMFGVLGHTSQRNGILAGFLSQINHFGSIQAWIGPHPPALRMWANGDGARLDPGNQMTTDWACLYFFHLDIPDPLSPYLEAVAREHNLPTIGSQRLPDTNDKPKIVGSPATNSEDQSNQTGEKAPQIPTGWCSWYHFFQDISADDILTNLVAAKRLKPELPLQIFQIDDGYESQWGDWTNFKDTFSQGLSPLADEIRAAGFTPGLWLAPFIVHPKSKLMTEHPDWLLRGLFNRPVNAGYFWGTFTTALDLTHPDAMEETAQIIHKIVHQWGFTYLKLDFLYVGALPGRHHDPSRTCAQILRHALQTIHQAAGEKTTLLGCGCPLGSAIGLVDAMRIGADVDPHWLPVHRGVKMRSLGDDGMPAARNAIHNTLTRAPLHRRWWINDPDCLLLHPNMELTLPEIQSLATVIAMSGGSVILSDHLPDLPPNRLRIAESLLPPIGIRPHVLDWFDSQTPTRMQVDLDGPAGCWQLLALFNWADKTQDIELRLSDFFLDTRLTYYAREFWGGKSYHAETGLTCFDPIVLEGIAAHGVALLAVRSYQAYKPQYLGSDLHISQGMEVDAWETNQSEVRACMKRPGRARGQVFVSLPQPPLQIWLDNRPIPWFLHSERCYRIEVEFEQTAEIVIKREAG